MPLDDHVDAHLLRQREVLADFCEQGLRRPGEVAAIADQPLNGGLTCFQQCPPGRERLLDTPGRVDSWSQVPVDRTTELIHPDHLSLTPLKPRPGLSRRLTLQAKGFNHGIP